MFIKKFKISNYKPFLLTDIYSFDLDINSPVQVIIGTNGCGKSTLLRTLTPISNSKNLFEKDGYFEMDIEHNGQNYTLITDYNNKQHTFKFINKEDDEDLNINGNIGIQNELIEKHFQFTDLIKKLTYFKYNFCDMGKSERKNVFLSANPIDLTFILQLHKKVLNKIKENKNNLNLLYKRKAEIEINMIEPELLEKLKKDKQEKNILNNNLDKLLFLIEQDISNIEQDYISVNLDTMDIKKLIKNINKNLINYKHLNRDNLIHYVGELNTNLISAQETLKSNNHNLTTIKNEITELEQIIEKNETNSSISIYEKEIKELELLLNKYDFKNVSVFLTRENIVSITENNVLSNILDIVHPLIENTYKLIPTKYFSRIENLQNRAINKVHNFGMLLNNSKLELEKITNELNILQNEIAPECTLNCKLRLNNFDKKKRYFQDIDRINTDILRYKKSIKKYEKVYSKISRIFTEQQTIQNILFQLKTIFDKYNFLYPIFSHIQIFQILKINPLQIVSMIDNTIIRSEHKLEYDTLSMRYNELTIKLLTLKEKNLPTLDFVKYQLIEKQRMFKLYLDETIKQEQVINELNIELSNLKTFEYYQTTILDNIDLFNKYSDNEVKKNTILYLETLYKKYNELKLKIHDELLNIDNTINIQESLKIRYEEEILSMITVIEKYKTDYEYLEKSLSPSQGIPYKYLTKYINNIINNINYFIKQIWSYDLILQPINEDITNEFSFNVKVKNTIIGDINNCSSGQKAIINICFTLAILLHTNILDKYPLYLDEPDAALDTVHKQNLLEFLSKLIDQELIKQLFLVNHHATISSGFMDSEIICLSDTNIVVPTIYNTNVQINKQKS